MNWFKKQWEKLTGSGVVISTTDISLIKSLLKNIIFIIATLKDANEDKKISWAEWLGIAKSTLPALNDIRKFKALKAQFLDFSTDEGKELIDFVIELGVLPGKAEIIVQHSFNVAIKLIALYKEDISPVVLCLKEK